MFLISILYTVSPMEKCAIIFKLQHLFNQSEASSPVPGVPYFVLHMVFNDLKYGSSYNLGIIALESM